MSTGPNTIIAFAGEDERYIDVVAHAARAARSSEATLILYDIDAAGLQAPLPTAWSAEGTRELFDSGRLTADMLDSLGRSALARQVRAMEKHAIETYGWLPGSSSLRTLAEYAESQGADMIVVPEHSDHRNLIDLLRGRDTNELPEETSIAVAVVGKKGVTVD